MSQYDPFMFSHTSKFASSLPGYSSAYNQRNAPFQMINSTQHRQFHQMKSEMPSDVLELFKANQIGFLKAPVKPKCRPLDPVCVSCPDVVSMFSEPNTEIVEEKRQTREEKRVRVAQNKREANWTRIEKELQQWNPFQDGHITSDPFKTLIICRLSYKTTEKSLKFEFERYGIIKSVRIVNDREGKSRGYGFVEFDSEDDFINAYKSANYRKIDGWKVAVDYEKGRTLIGWRPRRLGGGAGQLRLTRAQIESMHRIAKQKRLLREKAARSRSKSKNKKHKQKKDKKEKKDKKDKKDKKEKEPGEDGEMVIEQ